MNTQFTRKTISNGISAFTASVAVTVGCMFGAITAEASVQTISQSQSAQTRRVLAPFQLEAQQAAINDFLAKGRRLLASLDKIIAEVEGLTHASDDFPAHGFLAHAETLREVEKQFDQSLTSARLKGIVIDSDVKQCRKQLAQVRFKIAYVGSTLRRLEGNVKTFESGLDMNALHTVAATRTDILSQRIH
ncbi:hypothetical protein K7H09_19295 [Halomonas sp. IOP_14]|uniref:hypothetical protein n=1 Tax=Halomonas sp. IOP_14 TaxID=2873295 RepID=UPI001E34A480|nr:hypothetical protein [Halomonas sp. IOP_14]MCD1588151.1 hypothetical protein [Halomonas sp. IOP_14]